MRYERKEQFEKVNAFGTGTANTAYAQYFTGDSFLNPRTDPEGGLFAANVTFEPGCRNNWHIHHADKGGRSAPALHGWRGLVPGGRQGRRQPARGQRRDDPRQRQALARSEEEQLVQPYRRGGSRRELRERVVRAGIP